MTIFRNVILGLAAAAWLATGQALAATMTYEYQFELTDFTSTNGNTPPIDTLAGTISFTVDNEITSTDVAVDSASVTPTIGGTVFDESNVLIDFNNSGSQALVFVGGDQNGASGSNWSFDDFFVDFVIEKATGEVLSAYNGYYTIGSLGDRFNGASLSVSQISATPLPAALPLSRFS